MKLIITQPEIEAIVRTHVLNTVQLREGADIHIDFVATRGEDGITATIDIPYLGVNGIPAIAEASPPKEPAPAAAGKVSGKRGSILGTPKPPAAPEPDDSEQEAAQEDAGEAPSTSDAPAQPLDKPASEEAPAASGKEAPAKGPSLFGSNS